MADVICAHTGEQETARALGELESKLTGAPQLPPNEVVLLLFFCSSNHDGKAIATRLQQLAPQAEVVGCTTAGEFTHEAYGQGGVSLLALGKSKIKRCAVALAEFDKGQSVEASVHEAARKIATKLSVDPRELDPANWVGVLLNEGAKGNEEEVNEVLGHIAPLLSFVGGSAGDNLKLIETKVFYGPPGAAAMESNCGSVMVLAELGVPHAIVKSCSFAATSTSMRINRVQGRVVYEIDGKPALPTYAAHVGVPVEQLGHPVFMGNPLGVMIDGEPWVRSPVGMTPDGGLVFGCKIIEGSTLSLLKSTDILGDTRAALAKGIAQLGSEPSVGLLFNCAHRCVEVQIKQLETPYREVISDFPVTGFHSYGESWLAHMNHTLIALLLG